MQPKRTTVRKRMPQIPAGAKKHSGSTSRKAGNPLATPKKKVPKWVLHEWWLEEHGEQYRAALLRNIQERLPGLEALMAEAEAQWPVDRIHTFDPRSFEEYYQVQPMTQKIATVLQELL